MTEPPSPEPAPRIRSALREARAARAWSQSGAAAALRELAERRGGPDASAASLKTQLSRWENGHSRPEPEYRALLAELYGCTAAELGLAPAAAPARPDARAGLLAELAGAAAAGGAVLEQWAVQLAAAHRVDDELGAAGAGGITAALTEQLTRTLRHTTASPRRAAVAALLSDAAALAGRHALDADDPDDAWRLLDTAAAAAREAGSPVLALEAAIGRAEVLGEIGRAAQAVDLLEEQAWGSSPAAHRPRLAAARAVAHASTGDVSSAHSALDEATRSMPAIDAFHPGDPVFELADLHRWRGRALVELGDAAAVGPLGSALAAGPRSTRARADLHADLARTLRTDDAAGAAEHAREARALAERIGSRRLAARLDGSAFAGARPAGVHPGTPAAGDRR
ncbi:helix-turn-helix domain-containing protein [Pseudonocardia abyssalis]|uniref:Helix-turn-helix transcriptional regulator n=1 Tax=Pseudonocardia abyssalis TaxID=2792008 RepID=A0ABS6UUD4_9PSEU|nr:helix-turn-helix transcriptional regulator [Pseudonocardia abyssalis]MBW0118337.1 helix-turn-helix transcriptional regulator [Pseudonocardia abyssalis]MBW0135837.1 helix-turn-helix transcriptional regulator [Pseudonocardia abyssalis]